MLGLSGFIFDAGLDTLDLQISLLIRILVLLDEIFWLKDGSVGVNLDDIHVLVFSARDLLSCDNVTDIDNATIVLLSSIVIKEDVLSVVVSLIDRQELGSAIGSTSSSPAGIIITDGHGAVLLEGLKISLELHQVISENLSVVILINHVDVTVVCAGVAFVLTVDLNSLVETITGSVHVEALAGLSDPEVLGVLASIELHEGCTVPTVEAGVLSRAELVEFIHHIVQLSAESVENDSEFSLLLLHVHEETEEGWDQVVPSRVEQFRVHLSLSFDAGLFGYLGGILILLFFVALLGLFFFLLGHAAILTDAKLLTSTLGEAQSLEHLLALVLEFGAGATRSSELRLELGTSLFNSWVFSAIFLLDAWVDHIDVVLVADDIVGCLTLGEIREHGRILWLSVAQLVMDQVPNSFTLCLIASGHFLL